MLFKNIEIHNCKELIYNEEKNSYSMCRIPVELSKQTTDTAFKNNSGVELRFVPVDDEIKITLCSKPGSVTRAIVYFGSVISGWEHLYKNIYDYPTEIVIPKPKNLDFLQKVTDINDFPFSPEVVRIVLSNGSCDIIDVKGNCVPPSKEQLPQKTYLAYGSSITHGSLGAIQPNTYVSRIGEALKADTLNLGFPGNAKLEPGIADYIANECEFDFATIEMGVNILSIDPEDFRQRVQYFVSTVAKAHPDKKIFCTDIYFMWNDLDDSDTPSCHLRAFRKIVKKVLEELNLPNTVYINGLELLNGSQYLSQDATHPNPRGHEEIAANFIKVIKENI